MARITLMKHSLKFTIPLAVLCGLTVLTGCYYPAPAPYPVEYAPAPPPPAPMPAPHSGQECREYTKSSTIANQPQQVYGQACRQPDGSWEDMSNGATVENIPLNVQPPLAPAQPYPPPPGYYPAPSYYYPAPAYYAEPYPEVVIGGAYGHGGYRHWR